MAKMSYDETELSNPETSDLGPFERSILDDWYQKFKYFRCYPVVGCVSAPPSGLKLTLDQLHQYNGLQEVPPGRVDAPIYVSLRRKVLDVSYGGKEMYGPEGPYHKFAGHEASKALALMSLEPEHLDDLSLSGLSNEQQQVLDEWVNKLSAKYPLVGELV